jgi:serine/threonine-protein kinase
MPLTPEQARRLADAVFAPSPPDGGEGRDEAASTPPPSQGGGQGVGRAPECQQLSEAEPLPDLVIPGYRIIRVLGHGGMGMVYEAEQDRPRRRVAIKVINPEIMSRSAMRRFHFEAETLGRLSHPSIARIFAAGTIEPADGSGAYGRDARATTSGGGVLYFVMEFIPHARPITRYADERSLDLDARLELFVHVCDAVHYGHQKGFIHRDLKPANILVGSDSLSPGERAGVRVLPMEGTVGMLTTP